MGGISSGLAERGVGRGTDELLEDARVEGLFGLAAKEELLRVGGRVSGGRLGELGTRQSGRVDVYLVVPLEALPVRVELLQACCADLGDPIPPERCVSSLLFRACADRLQGYPAGQQERHENAQVLGAAGDLAAFLEAVCWVAALGLAQHKVLCKQADRVSVPFTPEHPRRQSQVPSED